MILAYDNVRYLGFKYFTRVTNCSFIFAHIILFFREYFNSHLDRDKRKKYSNITLTVMNLDNLEINSPLS